METGSSNSSQEQDSILPERYTICRKLGVGGMGSVYLVKDQELNNQEVAVKILHAHFVEDENVFARFRNEVIVARTLAHPNIVRLYDLGKTEDGHYYITMEYVDGDTLDKKIVSPSQVTMAEAQALEFSEALWIFGEVCKGVAYAHERGVIHRDLKPSNIMITKRNKVRLADFGTSSVIGKDATAQKVGQSVGTPDYMSPEEIRGEKPGPSSDIYSLGVIAFELLSGRRPFIADSPLAVAYKHLNEPVPVLNENRGIEMWCQGFVEKALAKERQNRFQAVEEMLEIVRERLWSKSYKVASSPGTGPYTPAETVVGKQIEAEKEEQEQNRDGDMGKWSLDGAPDEGNKWSLSHLREEEEQVENIDEKSVEQQPPSRFMLLFAIVLAVGVVIIGSTFMQNKENTRLKEILNELNRAVRERGLTEPLSAAPSTPLPSTQETSKDISNKTR